MFQSLKLACRQLAALVLLCVAAPSQKPVLLLHGTSLLDMGGIPRGVDKQFHPPAAYALLKQGGGKLSSGERPQEPQHANPVETKAAAFAIAEKALQWMPESLRRVLSRNLDGIRKGLTEIRGQEPVMSSERLRLEEIVLQRSAVAVSSLESRPKFSEAAKDFGALTQAMLLLNLPEADTNKLLALTEVIARNSSTFRIVVYDAAEIESGRDGLKRFLEALRQRRARLSERFGEVEVAHLSAASSGSLDPRSPLFGIAALVYSHAINDTARTWLWIWRSANGDMSGRPSLQAQP